MVESNIDSATRVFAGSNKKDQKNFAQQMTGILATFEKAREWADLSNSLQKLKRAIDQYPNEPVPVQKELAKRLAQCLNPDLNVIHNQTIEVYQHIFARQTSLMEKEGNTYEWGSDLGLFYSGLFNFYQYAAFEVKRKFLDFVSENVLKFEKELLTCLPGFLLCMIPALEDQNSELLKRVERILSKTEEIVGTSKFFGEIWKTMIRTPRARLSAIKFLDRKIPRTPKAAFNNTLSSSQNQNKLSQSRYEQIIKLGKMHVEDSHNPKFNEQKPAFVLKEREMVQRLQEGDIDAFCYFYYPNREHLVVNALLKGLAIIDNMDNPVYINRATFDFLNTHFPITSDLLSDEEKIRILEGALLNLKLRDFASHKKFFAWFQGHLEEVDDEPTLDDPALRTVVPALKRIFERFRNVRPQSTSGFQSEQQKFTFEIHTPLQLLLTLFDQNLVVARPVIKHTTVDLVRFIKHFYQMDDLDSKALTKLRGEVNNYFVMIKSELQIVWNALGDHLTGENLRSNDPSSLMTEVAESVEEEEQKQDSEVPMKAIALIAFCLKDLHPHIAQQAEDLHDIQEIKMERIRSQQEALIADQIIELQSKQLVPIISKLLTSIRRLSGQKMQNFTQVKPALQLMKQILEILNQRNQSRQFEGLSQLRVAINDFNDYYVDLCEYLLNAEDGRKLFGQRLLNFQACSIILCEIQRYAEPKSFDKMPRWLRKIIQFASMRNTHAQRILLTSSEILLDLLERIPEDQNEDNIQRIQELIMPKSQNKEVDIVSPSHADTNYCMNIIQNIWTLLGSSGDHVGLVSLLKRFDLILPRVFSDVVTQELNSQERDVKLHAIEKFHVFWKLTQDDYLEYKPFQPEHERLREMNQYGGSDFFGGAGQDDFVTNVSTNHQNFDDDDYSHAISTTDERERSYVALHQMLLILDDTDPTLRMKCRSWLQDSKTHFLRILDPLLKEFMDNNGMYRSGSGQLFYVKNYDADIVIENFSKMRNIILTSQDQFSSYVATTPCSDYIQSQFIRRQKLIKQGQVQPRFCKNKYIQALVMTTLSYIMGQAVESLNKDLFFHTQVVKASACEFMELILNSIKDYSDLVREVKHMIIGPIIKTLRTAIDNRNDAEQVHILNLLRVVLFEGEFYNKNLASKKEEHFKQIVSNTQSFFEQDTEQGTEFMSCLTDGMKNEVSFVRYHYILFAQKVVPFLKEIIASEKIVNNIKILFMCFCDLLHCCDVSAYNKDQNKKQQSSAESQYAQEVSSGANGLKKSKRLVITVDNDIVQIIEGFKVILKDCLKIKDGMSEDEEAQQEQLKALGKKTNDQSESYGIFSFFTKSGERKRDETETLTVKRALFEQIRNILLGCLNCWNELDVFKVRECFFTRLGIFPFHEKDAERISDNLKQYCIDNGYRLLNDQEEQKQEQQGPTLINTRATTVPINKGRMTIAGAALAKLEQNQKKRTLTLETYMQENFNPIQSSIISFFEPIAKSNPQQVIFGFLEIWKVSGNITQQGLNKNEACEKLIQMLLSMQIPPHQVVSAINEWILASDYITTKTTKEVIFDPNRKSMSTLQSLICHFVYTYLNYTITNYFPFQTNSQLNEEEKEQIAGGDEARKNYLKLLYEEMKKFFENFIWSRFPTTICWLLEILYLLSEKFLKHNKLDKRQRLEFCNILDRLLEKGADITSDKFGIRYTSHYGIDKICYSPTVYEMVKRFEFNRVTLMQEEDFTSEEHLNENLLFTKTELATYDEIPCLKGSMFESVSFVKFNQDLPGQNEMYKFMQSLNTYIHQGGRRRPTDEEQRDFNKIFMVVTLRQLLSKLTLNVHADDGRFTAEMIIVKPGLEVIKAQVSDTKNITVPSVKVYSEFMGDLMASLSEDEHFCRKYRVEIQNIFYHENFFLMSERTLRKWQIIMRHFSSSNEDLVDELLLKFSQVGGIFTSKSTENKQKAHTFKQLAFVIYSQDLQSEEQLDNLLKKMTEGFKNPQKDREMRIQLFLLSRIIMLRLPTDWLAGALKKMWPHLLAELVSVFDIDPSIERGGRDYSLTIEGIKIVELMSQLNIEDFQMNQWMFLFDGYGIDYAGSKDPRQDPLHDIVTSSRARQNQPPPVVEIITFQPYLVKFMCNKSDFDEPREPEADFVDYSGWQFNFYNVQREPLEEEKNFKEVSTTEIREPALSLELKDYEKQERHQRRADEIQTKRMIEAEVFRYAYKLQDLLARSNTRLTKLHRQSADALIERDFLKKPRNN